MCREYPSGEKVEHYKCKIIYTVKVPRVESVLEADKRRRTGTWSPRVTEGMRKNAPEMATLTRDGNTDGNVNPLWHSMIKECGEGRLSLP